MILFNYVTTVVHWPVRVYYVFFLDYYISQEFKIQFKIMPIELFFLTIKHSLKFLVMENKINFKNLLIFKSFFVFGVLPNRSFPSNYDVENVGLFRFIHT